MCKCLLHGYLFSYVYSDEMSSLAAEQFMWHKKAIVSEKLVKEKMEMQMLQLQVSFYSQGQNLQFNVKI